MIKKTVFCVALASLMLATSCSQDEPQVNRTSNSEIKVNPLFNLPTKAVETTISNLGSFEICSFQDGQANYMNRVTYSSSDAGKTWATAAGKFYWPTSGNMHFYAYAPVVPGQGGSYTINSSTQKLNDFVPNTAAKDQKDFVYAKATGSSQSNGSTGIGINFQHALSEISITAKNANTAYTVDVTGVRLGNITSKGTFTFPAASGGAASWAPSSDTGAKTNYTTTWSNPVRLTATESTLDASNVPFMLIPQQLVKATKASEKAYLALKVKVTMQGGAVIHDDWAYVGLDTNWQMGVHYNYHIDFTNGIGQKPDGTNVTSGTGIVLNVSVTGWSNQNLSSQF